MALPRLDMVRRRGGKMTTYLGRLLESEPVVRQPFEIGFAEMNACSWHDAIDHFRKAAVATKGVASVALLNLIGVCHYSQGLPGAALKDFQQSARLAEEFGDQQGKSRALGNIGLICQDEGRLDDALHHQQEALELACQFGDTWAVAIHLGHIGNIYHDKGELDRALENYQEALTTSQEIGDERGVATQLGNIGGIYHDKGDLDKALAHHLNALAISREAGDRWGEASNLGSIGSIYRDKGNLDEALKYDSDALDMAREMGYQLGVATDLSNIGLILTDKELDEQAVPKLAEAFTILLAIGVADGPRQTLTGLAGCEDRLGRKRLTELLQRAGREEVIIADLLDRIDMMRMKRPAPIDKRPSNLPTSYDDRPVSPDGDMDCSCVAEPAVEPPAGI